jgi:hypothetical protein
MLRTCATEAVTAGLLRKIGILRETGVELGFGRRHLAVGECDAIEHTDDALGGRA